MVDFYVDTSALLKRYRSESGSNVINALFDDLRRPTESVVTSQFSFLETVSVLARMRKGRVLRQSVHDVVLRRLQGDMERTIRVTSLGSRVMQAAVLLASRHALKAGDSIQLASALVVRGWTRNLSFVSADIDLLGAAQIEALPVLNPDEPTAIATLRSILS